MIEQIKAMNAAKAVFKYTCPLDFFWKHLCDLIG